jgi:hypothetical protein
LKENVWVENLDRLLFTQIYIAHQKSCFLFILVLTNKKFESNSSSPKNRVNKRKFFFHLPTESFLGKNALVQSTLFMLFDLKIFPQTSKLKFQFFFQIHRYSQSIYSTLLNITLILNASPPSFSIFWHVTFYCALARVIDRSPHPTN